MKKLYSAVAVAAMAVSFSVSANGLGDKVASVSGANAMDFGIAKAINLDSNVMRKAPAKAPATMENLTGYYEFEYVDMYSEAENPWVANSVEIIKGEKSNEVIIYGLFYDIPVKGTVNLEEGTISIPEQGLGVEGNITETEKTEICVVTFHWNEDGHGYYKWGEPVVLHYIPDGVQNQEGEVFYVGGLFADNHEIISFSSQELSQGGKIQGWGAGYGYHADLFNTVSEDLYGMSIFEYNEAEWSKCSVPAKLNDGWFAPAFNQAFPTYDVDVYVNKANPSEILLMNPYGKSSAFAQYNSWTAPGYIILNVEDPDLVLVKPLVPGGVAFDGGCQYFCGNEEGVNYYMNGMSIDEVKKYMVEMGFDVATMDDNKVVNLPNCRIAMSIDLETYTQWSYDGEVVEMVSQIELPEEAFTGVEGVTEDAVNAPKHFYNLQGVEVAQPAKGEVVIVKQGSRVSKEIAR